MSTSAIREVTSEDAPGAGRMLGAELVAAAERLEGAHPSEVLSWAFARFGGRVAIATGFGAEGMALVDIAARVLVRPKIFFIDTGFLFAETYELRRRIEERYGVEIEAVDPAMTPVSQADAFGDRLWSIDPDLCCRIRKVDPLRDRLAGLDAWVTAIRRDQTKFRATARAVEWDLRWGLVKVNPLAAWTRTEIWAHILDHRVPYNPLHDRGYPSIGCTHCTRAVGEGEDERAGRWAGRTKTECGLHG